MSKEQKDQLKETLDEAEWSWLKPHVQRDAVIVVAQGLDLLTVGDAVGSDDSKQVQAWIQKGQLSKPTADQIKAWDQTPAKRFMSLVVQPYVLIQEPLHH